MTEYIDIELYDRMQNEWRQCAKVRKCHYIAFAPPQSRVDFVLVAMMPSVNEKAADGVPFGDYPLNESDAPNGLYSALGDLILHHSVRRYLCERGEKYYITDLAKAAIPAGKVTPKLQREEFNFWYPKLLDELNLVAKPTATIIPVSHTTANFLRDINDKLPYRLTHPILHWSRQLTAAAKMASSFFPKEWSTFQKTATLKDVLETTEEAFKDAGLSQYFSAVSSRLKEESFGDMEKHYMFTYKKQLPLKRKD